MKNISLINAALVIFSNLLFGQNNQALHFKLAIAEPLRHEKVSDIANDFKRYKEKGYNAVYFENDYVTWTWNNDPDAGFGGNWKLFNIFDFTLSKKRESYTKYLNEFCAAAKDAGLDVYASFWIPKLNTEFKEYVTKNEPKAFGRYYWHGKYYESLCTCEKGKGLAIISKMVEQFMRENPQVKGLKVGTIDNSAVICDTSCPYAHGTTHADHVANLFKTIQDAMFKVRPDAKLIVYYWHWDQGYLQTVCSKLKKPYYIGCKVEKKTKQKIEEGIDEEPLWDASILTEEVGEDFKESIAAVSAENVIDMMPVGSGNDDFYFAAPPYPGRIYRRFKILDSLKSPNFMDFECGAHHPGSGEEAVNVYQHALQISEESFLQNVAKIMYKNEKAQRYAIDGWKAFDNGFGYLPIGLGGSNRNAMSGRMGEAWTMCIATPINFPFLLKDKADGASHWFSPYNFFTTQLSSRLETQFLKVLNYWQEASRLLSMADALEGNTAYSHREAVSAKAHVLGVLSALNWCHSAMLANTPDRENRFRDIYRSELGLTKEFHALLQQNPWVYDNNCWHPFQTPLSQTEVGFNLKTDRNPFEAKIRIIENYFKN
jgi:hypothetical protein